VTYLSTNEAVYQEAHNRLILSCEVGSKVHGLGTPDSDTDLMGVTVMSMEDVLGLSPFQDLVWRSADGPSVRSGADDVELIIYSMSKYLRLAAAGNPSILMLLFAPSSAIRHCTPVGLELRGHRGMFVTRNAGKKFLGYARAQRTRMVDSKAGVRAPRSNRPELVELHGFDTKFAMHMLRLGMQGNELMRWGDIEAPMDEAARKYLLDVRAGRVPYELVLERAEELERDLATAIDSVDLPDKVDEAEFGRLSRRLHSMAWGL